MPAADVPQAAPRLHSVFAGNVRRFRKQPQQSHQQTPPGALRFRRKACLHRNTSTARLPLRRHRSSSSLRSYRDAADRVCTHCGAASASLDRRATAIPPHFTLAHRVTLFLSSSRLSRLARGPPNSRSSRCQGRTSHDLVSRRPLRGLAHRRRPPFLSTSSRPQMGSFTNASLRR